MPVEELDSEKEREREKLMRTMMMCVIEHTVMILGQRPVVY